MLLFVLNTEMHRILNVQRPTVIRNGKTKPECSRFTTLHLKMSSQIRQFIRFGLHCGRSLLADAAKTLVHSMCGVYFQQPGLLQLGITDSLFQRLCRLHTAFLYVQDTLRTCSSVFIGRMSIVSDVCRRVRSSDVCRTTDQTRLGLCDRSHLDQRQQLNSV